jgi:hypothetical protein
MRIASAIVAALTLLTMSIVTVPQAKATVLGSNVAQPATGDAVQPVDYYKRHYHHRGCYHPYKRYWGHRKRYWNDYYYNNYDYYGYRRHCCGYGRSYSRHYRDYDYGSYGRHYQNYDDYDD